MSSVIGILERLNHPRKIHMEDKHIIVSTYEVKNAPKNNLFPEFMQIAKQDLTPPVRGHLKGRSSPNFNVETSKLKIPEVSGVNVTEPIHM